MKEGVTEELKAKDQMKWVGMMNNIRTRAEEIVVREMIVRGRKEKIKVKKNVLEQKINKQNNEKILTKVKKSHKIESEKEAK